MMILAIILGLTAIIAGALIYGSMRWQAATNDLHTTLEAGHLPIRPTTIA